jgi:hypothetical protein
VSIFDDMSRVANTYPEGDLARAAQDYVVLPQQCGLDGIAVRPGIVKQLVAVPTASRGHTAPHIKARRPVKKARTSAPEKEDAITGASIESQMTGRGTIGGIQLQIIPEFDLDRMRAGNTADVMAGEKRTPTSRKEPETEEDDRAVLLSYKHPIPASASAFDLLKTPRELGLREGQHIHMKDMKNVLKDRPKTIRDLFRETPTSRSSDGSFTAISTFPSISQ